ncbi:MAG: cupin domain-containing protein [Actinomycetota bacterium]|nr:cupin domain-containing protein [Actinomycetota bacterium]
MIIYEPHHPVPESELVDLGDPADLGGKVLEGDPRISARFDYRKNGVTAGVFQSTAGVIEVTFPFTEHATILDGAVTITDAAGSTHTYRPGDSYVIEQDAVVRWEVRGRPVQKSFLNIAR